MTNIIVIKMKKWEIMVGSIALTGLFVISAVAISTQDAGMQSRIEKISGIYKLKYGVCFYSKEIAMENHTKMLYIDGNFYSYSKPIPATCYPELGVCCFISGVAEFNFELDTTILKNGLHELKILNNDGGLFKSIIVLVQN